MDKKQAQNLVGQLVECWTGLNGNYIGECVSIESEPRRPWRANVRILAVTEYPVQGLRSGGGPFIERHPLPYNAVRNFGNSSVKPYLVGNTSPDYQESLREALEKAIQRMERGIEYAKERGLPYWIEERAIGVLRGRLAHGDAGGDYTDVAD